MANPGSLFPKRLTIFGLVFLIIVLGFGLYSALNGTRLLHSLQKHDVPALQISCAATRLIGETQQLLESKSQDDVKVKLHLRILDQSLREMLDTMEDYPEGIDHFEQGEGYQSFQKLLSSPLSIEEQRLALSRLRADSQTFIEDYMQFKDRLIDENIFIGNLAIVVIAAGLVLFFTLLYAIYYRYQRNLERLEQVSASLELERMANLQSSKLASLGEMAAGLAHEINNPLAVIMGRAEMLMETLNSDNPSPLEMNRNLGKIQEMAVRISKIVTSMRKVSKGNAGGQLAMISLAEVLEDILNLSTQRLKNKSIELDYKEFPLDLKVKSNFTQLSQVIINIMNNAMDELEKLPDDQRRIEITAKTFETYVELRIADSGKGIPEAIRLKIFEPFFTTKEVGQGTGLGLSISRTLMQEMGGDLTLAPEAKTCFILKIPRI
jgi:C4-dicarboxylate-specific signal transduction histidine kinase